MNQIKIAKQVSELNNKVQLYGVNPHQWYTLCRLEDQYLPKKLFIFESSQKAEDFYEQIKHKSDTFFFPDFVDEIYSSISNPMSDAFMRFRALHKLTENPQVTVITTIKALQLFVPSFSFFKENRFTVEISDIISPHDLAARLVAIGYEHSISIEERGSFSKKGEIFDIFPLIGPPFRINYFDDMIETIYEISKDSLKTIYNKPLQKAVLHCTPFIFLQSKFFPTLRENLPRYGPKDKELNYQKNHIFTRLNDGLIFEDFNLCTSSYFQKSELTILQDYFEDFFISYFNKPDAEELLHEQLTQLETDERTNFTTKEFVKPLLSNIYSLNPKPFNKFISVSLLKVVFDLSESFNEVELGIEVIQHQKTHSSTEKINILSSFISSHRNVKKIYIVSKIKSHHAYIKNILNGLFPQIELDFIDEYLDIGFYYTEEKTLFLADSNFISQKSVKTKTKKEANTDLFADQISTLKEGDYLVHKEFGVGIYRGIESLSLNQTVGDFIIIEYKDSDKVYLPVYKMNYVQKYADEKASPTLSNLKTQKFDQLKSKAKNSIKKLAFDLLELQAKRALHKGFAFSPPDQNFEEFSNLFPFKETIDQVTAINDVLDDMVSSQPMDRLICGDVGFGKTEVAMRAAFKAVLDSKQVAVLVPTTVLAFQHYNTFMERFKNFPVNIELLSRFRSTKESKLILEKAANGEVDILIGTHKLLSKGLNFKSLGLIIIDEEQRFGVAHKEKLKLLKESVDTLTLTATPIPRTLQMSFLGIKELSLIKTAPPKRQSIKTFIIKDDSSTIKQAIEKELNRGGQVFIVHNKVKDIEIFSEKIRSLVPTARLVFAHGQLPEKELERRITDFYNYKFDILISTTIIESGIDIPRANTMIIDRADTFGLSQLHQLRGRIGRSDKKAYAYFMLPKHGKLSDVATKRLRALQSYADIGSGFALATSDLEIRGSGDVLGPEQSGHMASIGLELYMELLEDAIREIKGLDKKIKNEIEVLSSFKSFIPSSYIENSGLRLKYYKKLSQAESHSIITDLTSELIDQFGNLPPEVENLITILESRIHLSQIGLKSIKIRDFFIDLYFDEAEIARNPELQSKILQYFMGKPNYYKFNQNYSINCKFKEEITLDAVLKFSKYIAQQILPC